MVGFKHNKVYCGVISKLRISEGVAVCYDHPLHVTTAGCFQLDIWKPLPSVIFGVFSIVSGGLSLLLPETLNMKMPDTIADAEEIGR